MNVIIGDFIIFLFKIILFIIVFTAGLSIGSILGVLGTILCSDLLSKKRKRQLYYKLRKYFE